MTDVKLDRRLLAGRKSERLGRGRCDDAHNRENEPASRPLRLRSSRAVEQHDHGSRRQVSSGGSLVPSRFGASSRAEGEIGLLDHRPPLHFVFANAEIGPASCLQSLAQTWRHPNVGRGPHAGHALNKRQRDYRKAGWVRRGCGRHLLYAEPRPPNEFFADKIAELGDCPDVDSIYIKDPSGLLTPERLESLLPTLRGRLNRLQINEIHTHCNTGVAPITLLKAADLGVTKLHCALPPVANGSSHSNALQLARNLKARGHSVAVDMAAMEAASACLTREATLFNLASGAPVEYDEAYYAHTLPGGVPATTRRQLNEMGRSGALAQGCGRGCASPSGSGLANRGHAFCAIYRHASQHQFDQGERYSRITDEVVDLLLGEFGPMPGKVDQDPWDRALQTPRAKQGRNGRDEPSLDDVRAKIGATLSDEDLLLRAVMPAEQVDAMAKRRQSSGSALSALLESLGDGKAPYSVSIRAPGGRRVRRRRKVGEPRQWLRRYPCRLWTRPSSARLQVREDGSSTSMAASFARPPPGGRAVRP